MKDSSLPIIGQTYNFFDDGKISLTRRMDVVITEIIPFKKIDSNTSKFWKGDIAGLDYLYAKNTDYFIKAELKISESKTTEIIFVRTVDNGWFSLGFWCGRLDVDGTLIKQLKQQ